MSKKFDLKLNGAGIREMLKSEEMQSIINEKASDIRNRCGEGYDHNTLVGKNRAVGMVWADTNKARNENSKYNTLLKAVK